MQKTRGLRYTPADSALCPKTNTRKKAGRPRTYTPEEAAARDRAQKAASAKRNRAATNERRRERRFRHAQKEMQLRAGHEEIHQQMSVVSALNLNRPNLLYIDHHGTVHQEIWQTAEELIESYKKERKNQ